MTIVNNELKKQEASQKLTNWNISKEEILHNWIDMDNTSRNKVFQQGQIVYCELGENIGYEICESRPSIIVSDDRYSSKGQLVVVPLTKNVRRNLRTHYTLYKSKYSFLSYDSCVKTEQVKSISSIRVNGIIGQVDTDDMRKIKVRLKSLFKI